MSPIDDADGFLKKRKANSDPIKGSEKTILFAVLFEGSYSDNSVTFNRIHHFCVCAFGCDRIIELSLLFTSVNGDLLNVEYVPPLFFVYVSV